MINEYMKQEVAKIMADDSLPYPKNIAYASAWILGNLKGMNLKILNVQGQSSLADYFLLASAQNVNQARAMLEDIQGVLKEYSPKRIHAEGLKESEWLLLDIGDVLVHVFLESVRDIYDLDALWAHAQVEPIPQSYYMSEPKIEKNVDSNVKDAKDRKYF